MTVIPRSAARRNLLSVSLKSRFLPQGDFPVERDRDLRGVALLGMTPLAVLSKFQRSA